MAIISIGKNSIANLETVFDETNEFTKDMKKLNKKYNSIYEDLEIFKAALITALPAGLPGIFAISDLGDHIELPVYKVKKFRCKSLKGNGVKSGIRLIYTYYPSIRCHVPFSFEFMLNHSFSPSKWFNYLLDSFKIFFRFHESFFRCGCVSGHYFFPPFAGIAILHPCSLVSIHFEAFDETNPSDLIYNSYTDFHAALVASTDARLYLQERL